MYLELGDIFCDRFGSRDYFCLIGDRHPEHCQNHWSPCSSTTTQRIQTARQAQAFRDYQNRRFVIFKQSSFDTTFTILSSHLTISPPKG